MSPLLAVTYDPDLIDPPARGLFEAVRWIEDGVSPQRWLPSGVTVRQPNFSSGSQTEVWAEAWNVAADDVTTDKVLHRDDLGSDDFTGITVFAFDRDECPHRLMQQARREVHDRAGWLVRRYIQGLAEAHVATALGTATTTTSVTADVVAAVAAAESALFSSLLNPDDAVLFAPPVLAAHLAKHRQIDDGRSPLGYRWVFSDGLGLVDGSGQPTILGTTQLFGWRGPLETRDHIDHQTNDYFAVAEQSLVIGWESSVVKVTILNPPDPEEP